VNHNVAVDYSLFQRSLRNLEVQHDHLLHLSPEYPLFVHEGMAESVIQRFKTCYDMLWKVLRGHLMNSLGLPEVPNSPRPIFRIADQNNLLAAGSERWECYVQTRIDTIHDYDQVKAENAIEIMPEFIADAVGLYTELTGEAWE